MARRIAAALAYISLAQDDRVTLMSWGAERKILRGRAQGRDSIFNVLQSLKDVSIEGRAEWSTMSGAWHRDQSEGVLFIISDFYERDGMEKLLREWNGRRERVIGVQVLSADEREPGLHGPVRLVDAESGILRELDVTREVLDAYRQELARDCEELEQVFRTAEHHLVRTWTDRPIEEFFRSLVRGGGVFHLRSS
jgi:uncharacterized protein (DUF58 family)